MAMHLERIAGRTVAAFAKSWRGRQPMTMHLERLTERLCLPHLDL
jgi:hypothetical protein